MNGQPYLSKSRLISAWQCQKKLYLEKHHPELGEVSADTESLFATGHQVGAISQDIYGATNSVEIPFNRKMSLMVRETTELLDGGADFPIFEATFQYDGVLVRVDVLIPVDGAWRAIEIKASTRVKPVHVIDCAIQLWVMRSHGLNVSSIALGYIDNQFVYQGDGDYSGLIVEQDLTEDAEGMQSDVVALIADARASLSGAVPDIRVGAHCDNPYECQFKSHCWPMDAEYPVTGLGGSKAKLAAWVNTGHRDIRDVDISDIPAVTQQRIHRVTVSGEPEVIAGAAAILDAMAYPRYYLDFETIRPAVPIWAETRPYSSIPIQWSCHIDDGSSDGSLESLRHEEFLDLSGEPPMRALAEKMIECLGSSGPVLMWTNYERGVINGLIEMFPDLTEPLQKIIDRLFDLHPVVKEHYYHPNMLGSWSIKAVLPAMVPHMNYANLEGIHEGMAASDGYLEAIGTVTPTESRVNAHVGAWRAPTDERKAELEEQLLRYCKFDTEAMVEIARFLSK